MFQIHRDKMSKKSCEKKIAKVEKENIFLRDLNESLLKDKKSWQERVQLLQSDMNSKIKEKDVLIRDLRDQLRDVMVFLEAQSVVAQNSEMKESTVSLPTEEEAAAAAELDGPSTSSGNRGRDATHKRLKNKLKVKKQNM